MDLGLTDARALIGGGSGGLGGAIAQALRDEGARTGLIGRPGDKLQAAAIDGTLWSAIRLLRAALPHLREGRDPAILVILSSSAREPISGLTTSNLIRP